MRIIFCLCCLLLLTSSYAQDTIYMNNDYREVEAQKASYYKIVEKVPGKEYMFIRKTYYLDGHLKAKQQFRKKGDDFSYEGRHQHWYKSGKLFYEVTYKNDRKHGDLIAFWKNGKKRRHDIFKRGKLKSGTVWNSNGEKIDYFEHMIPSRFPGGEKALNKYLKKNLIAPEGQKEGTAVKVNVIFIINERGMISEIKIYEGAPQWYNSVAAKVLSEMPPWEPAQRFGKPIKSRYSLPLIFVK